MKKLTLIVGAFFLSACGYHFQEGRADSSKISVSIPYITGDKEGALHSELVYQLSASGAFACQQRGGRNTLQVVWVFEGQDRIGFRYDRDNPKGAREKNLLGVEDRRTVTVEISLVDSVTQEVLFGPKRCTASVDYDYTDPGAPRDQVVGRNEPIMQFSLGQLDSAEGAFDSSSRPLFRKLAQKIVAELTHCSDL